MTTRKSQALQNFPEFSEAKISVFSDAVIAALTGNAYFPTAAPILASLVTAQQAYAAALSASKGGSRMEAEDKNVTKEVVITLLRELCSLVNFVAAGDRYKLLSSGFDISKDVISPVVIEPAKNVVINYGANSGEMVVKVKGVKGHKGLVFEYAVANEQNQVADDATWIGQPSSAAQCTILNMPVGQRVMIRIGITGPRRQLVYTAPIMRMVA